MASHRSARQAGYPPGGPPAEQSMRQIVEKKMLEARVVAPTQNISHKLADVHDFPAVKAFLENVDKEISDRNKLWVPETEAWLGRQFKTDSIAAHTHQLVLNSHELQVHIVMGCEVLTHFVNYQDWKQAFFKAAFPNGIQTTVGDYARNICIKPSDPKMATCCVDLQRKLQAAFALLHEPFVVPEYLQVQRILQAIPKHERAEVYADRKTSPVEFAEGDKVWLSTEHLLIRNQPARKFRQRYIGPYPVTAKISSQAYRLRLPPTFDCHNVFHISRLRQCVNPDAQPDTIPSSVEPPVDEFVVERVLDFSIERREDLYKRGLCLVFLVDDVMGVGEDPVGEDGMDIDAPAWPPAGVEPAMRA
eukprot:jgi/Tetstr1/461788/TSEL_006875.t1